MPLLDATSDCGNDKKQKCIPTHSKWKPKVKECSNNRCWGDQFKFKVNAKLPAQFYLVIFNIILNCSGRMVVTADIFFVTRYFSFNCLPIYRKSPC